MPRDLNHFCKGCYACIEDEKRCPFYLEKQRIMEKVEKADLLIMTTPNYCMAPSAPMKAFMDLTFTYWMSHKPRKSMFGKRAVVISTTAGMGAGHALRPIATMLFYWGVPWIKKYAVAVQAKSWDSVSGKKKQKINRDMKRLAKIISAKEKSTPLISLKTRFLFSIMAAMQKGNMGSGEAERKYWEEQGWLGKEKPWKNR